MKTQTATTLAGNAAELAKLLEISPSAVSQWGEDVPASRVYQLRVIKPSWFKKPKVQALEPEAQHD